MRYWGGERIEQYIRITVGAKEDMDALLGFLEGYLPAMERAEDLSD